jgi:DNA-binding winged helix-turn-helix (wHTH) protein/tetratricopeptide (TPR) repeat protein
VLKLRDLAERPDFALGVLRVSPSRRRIAGPAGEVHVEPLIMQVFLLLSDAEEEVVTRTRLFDECWGGVIVGDESLNRAITMIRRALAETAPGMFESENIPRTGYRLVRHPASDGKGEHVDTIRKPVLLLMAAFLLVGMAALGWFLVSRAPRAPSAALVAASDPHSAELAGDIASATMATAAAHETPLRLLDRPAGGDAQANFILKVATTRRGNQRKVDLALLAGADKALLWSWSAARPDPSQASVLDALARESGALALTCAAETRSGSGREPDDETVKLYLDACAKFEPWLGADVRLLADAFEHVTAKAPQLRGAWAKLFLSRAEAIEGLPRIDMAADLRNDIKRAAALRIDIPETYIARAAVLPLNARLERLNLYEQGLARYPRNLALLSARSWQLRSVGRMVEAAKTAQRAVELYPQSAAANAEYAKSLMHAGQIDAARNVLERANGFAPNAPNLTAARWLLEMRYGDPKVAMAMARSGGSVVEAPMLSFLEARIEPSRASIDGAIEQLMAGYRQFPEEPGWVAQALGAFGRNEEAIQFLLHYPAGANSGDGAEMLFRPTLRGVRRDPRFILIARNFGVTDYWVRSGILPDYCFDPSLPYDCKQELAKLARR